jgi:hypothetical protein
MRAAPQSGFAAAMRRIRSAEAAAPSAIQDCDVMPECEDLEVQSARSSG